MCYVFVWLLLLVGSWVACLLVVNSLRFVFVLCVRAFAVNLD